MFFKNASGMSVIELLVALAIIGIISAIVFGNQSEFTDNLEIKSATDSMILALREAQVSGLAVRETGSGSGEFEAGYGIYIEDSGDTLFKSFIDEPVSVGGVGNGIFDSGETSVDVLLQNGVIIEEACGRLGGSDHCLSSGAGSLHLVFNRPRPTPRIYMDDVSGTDFDFVKIWILSGREERRAEVTVEKTGQVSVEYSEI